MSFERSYIDPGLHAVLSEAYKRTEVNKGDKCSKIRTLVDFLPLNTPFQLGEGIVELVNPCEEEIGLFTYSRYLRQEAGLIVTDRGKVDIDGSAYSIQSRHVYDALYQLKASEESVGYFSHTHWDTRLHPLPSIPDIINISFLHLYYPHIEGRAIFERQGKIKVFKFSEQIK